VETLAVRPTVATCNTSEEHKHIKLGHLPLNGITQDQFPTQTY
jgi:hypothetical protein